MERNLKAYLIIVAFTLVIPAALANACGFRTIDFPGASSTGATGINDRGQIVGSYMDRNSQLHGFLLDRGNLSTIDLPGVSGTGVTGINDRGQIVGSYMDSSGQFHGFFLTSLCQKAKDWKRKKKGDEKVDLDRDNFSTIDFPGSLCTGATGINDQGQIVGYYVDNGGQFHGFFLEIPIPRDKEKDEEVDLDRDSFSTIDFPGALSTGAIGINDRGQIVGSYVDSSGQFHGFLLARGNFSTIDFPGALTTVATGINDRGRIVGHYVDSDSKLDGFILDRDDFSTIGFPEVLCTGAIGINNRGQIVGCYEDSNGDSHGFIVEKAYMAPPASSSPSRMTTTWARIKAR